MADEGHERTDAILEKLEKKIEREYKKAAREVDKKAKDYFAQFRVKEEAERKRLEAGEITQEQFDRWRVTQMLTGKRWEQMRDTLTADMVNANNIARSTMFDHMSDVYALNRNYAAYQVESSAKIDTSWTLYNNRSTEFLFTNKGNLLPPPKEGGKAWQAMMNKDTRWNQQKINSSLIQGILQGDSIAQISDRLFTVVGMNANSAVRSARTMTTYVENKGRDDTYDDLREKGIELDTVWVATLDDRTRSSHRWLHGEVRDETTGRYSNGLHFPGDPSGEPEEVYNCRCCETSTVKGFPIDVPKWSPKMGDMTFEEWLGEKEEKAESEPAKEPFAPAKTIQEAEQYASRFAENVSYGGLSLKNANAINEQLTELTDKYPVNKFQHLGIARTRGAMAGNCNGIKINGKKLGSALSDEANVYQQRQNQTISALETIRSRYSGKIPSGVQRQMDKLEDQLLFSRWGVHSSYEDHVKAVLTHEYGHLLSDQYFGMINSDRANEAYRTNPALREMSRRWDDAFNRAIKSGDIHSLSEYGRTNVHEFFAESFLAREMGETLPPYVEELMKEVLDNGIM